MGVFDDKKYDQLDWVSQAVQPIETPLALLLENMPDKFAITWDWFKSGSLDKSEVVQHLIEMHDKSIDRLTYTDKAILEDCFMFEMPEQNREIYREIVLDLENETMDGEIFLIKTKFILDEDKLKSNLGEEGRRYLAQMNYSAMDFPRANEMLELLEKTDEALRSRSGRTKRIAMTTRLTQIFANNEWNIKSTELANKVGKWIRDYVDNGNLAALSNITRLKVMTYKGGPIYSVEEA